MKFIKKPLFSIFLVMSTSCGFNLENKNNFSIKANSAQKDLCKDKSKSDRAICIEDISKSFIPCGVAGSNVGKEAKKPFKECSYGDKKNTNNIYLFQYLGVLDYLKNDKGIELENSYWNKRKEYVNYMTESKYKSDVEKIVNAHRDYRYSKYSFEEYPVSKIYNLNDVYDLNYTKLKHPKKNEFIILHRTGGKTAKSAIATFSPKVDKNAHYLIDDNGSIYSLLADDLVAYHAGKTYKPNLVSNLNSIGIEVVGETNETPLTEAQRRSVSYLVLELAKKYGIKRTNVCPHEFVTPKSINEGNLYYPLILEVLKKHNGDSSEPCKSHK